MKLVNRFFLFIFALILSILLIIGFLNTYYLEKFYVKIQKEKLLKIGKVLVDPNYIVDIQNLEINSNVVVSIKSEEEIKKLEQYSMLSQDNINNILEHLKKNVPVFSEVTFLDYRNRSLILFLPCSPGKYYEITTSFNFLFEGLDLSTKYHIFVLLMGLIVGCIGAYLFAKRMTTPIVQLKDIAEKISKQDFSKQFEINRKDEIGALGLAINNMSSTLKKNIEDINEKNKLLEKDIEHEREIDKMRKEFIANVSHELKTPIAIIQGYAQGLLENVDNAEDKEFYCNTIIEESNTMHDLVRKLLLISKMDSKHIVLNLDEVEYHEEIENLIARHALSERKIKYYGPDKFNVVCDETYIDMVMNNFITNAIKYSPSDSEIKINVDENQDTYTLSVSNLTEGLKEEDITNIWTPFYRRDDDRDKEGHGLGLAIVKGVLENHKSQYGTKLENNWITFWFTLNKKNIKI